MIVQGRGNPSRSFLGVEKMDRLEIEKMLKRCEMEFYVCFYGSVAILVTLVVGITVTLMS